MFIRSLLTLKLSTVWVACVLLYHSCIEDPFLNVAYQEGTGLEKIADTLLVPYQYAFMGRVAVQRQDGSWHFEPRFDYSQHFWIKNISCWVLAPLSLDLGGAVKILACLSSEVRNRYQALKQPQPVYLHNELYQQMGLFQGHPISQECFVSQQIPRRPGDEQHLAFEKEGLRDIGAALTKNGILWWVDCGTCLGAYRHGGVIPWDYDIDIAILEPDFENVYQLLRRLNPQKYLVVDLSARDHPMSLLRVFLRQYPECEIDIYHFRIDPQNKTLSFILSQENLLFSFESWKIRERPFKTPAKFEDVFPLKPALFDGIPIFVPNQIASYLSRVYGQNLAPARIYNPQTGSYEKDLSHPYWQRPFAH